MVCRSPLPGVGKLAMVVVRVQGHPLGSATQGPRPDTPAGLPRCPAWDSWATVLPFPVGSNVYGRPSYGFAISRCQRSQVDMRNIVTRLRFLSQGDQGLFTPLIARAPSGAYSTMSRTAAATMGHPSPELVHPVASVGKDDDATTDVPVFSPRISDEPIVTRKELWSYYCMYYSP